MYNSIQTINPTTNPESDDLFTKIIGIEDPNVLVGCVMENLNERGEKASALYVDMYFSSIVLAEQLVLYETGHFDMDKLRAAGFDIMIEEVNKNPVLTEEMRFKFIGKMNVLKQTLKSVVIEKTRAVASEGATFVTERKQNPLMSILKGQQRPKTISLSLDAINAQRLKDALSSRYTDREEAKRVIYNLLNDIISNSPKSIQMNGTNSFAHSMGYFSAKLSENNDPRDLYKIALIHKYMTGEGAMKELNIDPRILEAIYNKVYTKFSGLRGGNKVAMIPQSNHPTHQE